MGIEYKSKQKNELEHEPTDHCDEFLNVDLSKIKVPFIEIHPKWESLFQFTELKVSEELGPEFKLSKDLCNFSFYTYRSLSFDFVSFILIFNMTAFALDDYLDKFPGGNEKLKFSRFFFLNYFLLIDSEKIIRQFGEKNFLVNGIIEKWWRLVIKDSQNVMRETTLNQLLDHLIFCLNKSLEMNRRSIEQSFLSVDDYLQCRLLDSGAQHQLFLVFIGTDNQLTEALNSDPNYIGLNQQVALHVSLVNELYSLRKEVGDKSYKQNYVYVKMKNDSNMTAQDAVNEIIAEINESERMARLYGERLKEIGDRNLYRYVDAIYDVIAGNHYWSTICKRYNRST